MDKKRKWERDYEEYAGGALDARLAELEEKVHKKPTTEEEYREDKNNPSPTMSKVEWEEYNKLKAIKENLPKVKNILELRTLLDSQIEEIKAELKIRGDASKEAIELGAKQEQRRTERLNPLTMEIGELEEEEVELEKAMQVLEQEMFEIQNALDAKGLDKTVKQKLLARMEINSTERNKNNTRFRECGEMLAQKRQELKKESAKVSAINKGASTRFSKKIKNLFNAKFNNMSTDELETSLRQISMHRSKCHIACNKLMQGEPWEAVEVALDGFKGEVLKASGDQAEKIALQRKAVKAEDEIVQEGPATGAPVQRGPATGAPVQRGPVQRGPATGASVQRGPVQRGPATGAPVQRGPAKEGPAKEGPAKEGPEQKEMSLTVPTKLQKFGRWVKNVINKLFRNEPGEELVEEEEPGEELVVEELVVEEKPVEELVVEEKPVKELVVEEKQPSPQDAFRKYLKEVAEKGLDGIAEEQRQQEERERQAQAKKATESLKQLEQHKKETIEKDVKRLVEARREAAQREGRTFDEAATKQKATEIAERNYNEKYSTKEDGMDR